MFGVLAVWDARPEPTDTSYKNSTNNIPLFCPASFLHVKFSKLGSNAQRVGFSDQVLGSLPAILKHYVPSRNRTQRVLCELFCNLKFTSNYFVLDNDQKLLKLPVGSAIRIQATRFENIVGSLGGRTPLTKLCRPPMESAGGQFARSELRVLYVRVHTGCTAQRQTSPSWAPAFMTRRTNFYL